MASEDELLDAILANRDDRDAYRVYGDALEGRGDPRGELVEMQLRADESGLEDGKLLVAIKNHFIRHPALTPPLDQWRARFQWKWGCIVGAELDDPSPDDLVVVLDHPSCVLLHRLQLELDGPSAPGVLDRLEQSRPTLETLIVRQGPAAKAPGHTTDELLARLPRLQHLDIEGHDLIRVVRHAGLRSLGITGTPFRRSTVWDLPALSELEWVDPRSVKSLTPLWTSALPALRKLQIFGDVKPDYATEGFLTALARLEVLVMPASAFGESAQEVCEALLAHAQAFAHLKSLGLDWGGMLYEEDPDLVPLWAALRQAIPSFGGPDHLDSD